MLRLFILAILFVPVLTFSQRSVPIKLYAYSRQALNSVNRHPLKSKDSIVNTPLPSVTNYTQYYIYAEIFDSTILNQPDLSIRTWIKGGYGYEAKFVPVELPVIIENYTSWDTLQLPMRNIWQLIGVHHGYLWKCCQGELQKKIEENELCIDIYYNHESHICILNRIESITPAF